MSTENAELVPSRTRIARIGPAPVLRRSAVNAWLREVFVPPPATSYLHSGERCIIATRRHLLVPVLAILRAGAMMTAVGLLTVVMPGVFLVQLALWLGALAHTAWVGYCVLLWRTDELVVTDTRLIRVSGLLTLTVDAVPLCKITDATLRRSIPGRIFGYGSIRVETSGQKQGGLERMDFVPGVESIYRATLR